MKRLIILLLIAGSGIAFYVFADLESMSSAILSMPTETMIALLVLLVAVEILKGLRWAFFLRSSRLDIRTVDGLTSYLASQAAAALPGNSMLSARLAREHGNVRLHQAVAGLVGQGIADVIGISLIAALAIVLTEQQRIQLLVPVITLVGAGAGVALIRSDWLAHRVTTLLQRWRLTRRFLPEEMDFRNHAAVLMHPRTLGIGVTYSSVITGLSAAILLTIVNTVTQRGIAPGETLYVHSLSTIARLALPVPGGYGVSDGSLTGLLNFIGIGLARATFIALSYRSIGLLFRTFFGLLVLIARYPHLLVGPLRVPRTSPARLPARERRPRVQLAPSPEASRPSTTPPPPVPVQDPTPTHSDVAGRTLRGIR